MHPFFVPIYKFDNGVFSDSPLSTIYDLPIFNDIIHNMVAQVIGSSW